VSLESGKTPEKITEPEQSSVSSGSPDSPDDKGGGPKDERPEGLDWTIDVDDTISGKYQLPAGGKVLEYNITLRLAAWKSGGDEVFGRYTGEAYILFEFDESGLSDADYLYMGGGTFNRKCENLEFEVEVYDQEELNQKIVPIPDKVSVVPLRKFNAMAFSDSVWSTILQMDQTVIGRKSGDTLSQIKDSSGESSSDVMGIDLFIDNGHVTVDIPTYRLTWNCGYFTGTVVSSPLGTAKRHKLDMPDVRLMDPDATDNGEKEIPDQIQQNENDFEYPIDVPNELNGQYIQDDPNGLSGFDRNGDGKVDMYIGDDGKLYFDLNLDGVFDDLDNMEVEWGQG